ncbi:MAG: transglutaminase family protein [Verrucomicrobia bacterium]|nr:transglutaminase family protein [Verrucomicrobiota bacterium]
MRYEIVHRTRYAYAAPVRESFNEVRLMPVSNEHQKLDSFLLKVFPPTRLRHYKDFYSNCVHHFELPEPHDTLLVESQLQVTTRPPATLPLDATPFPFAQIGEAAREERCYEFLQPTRFVDVSPEAWRLALDVTVGQTDTWQASLALMRFVCAHLKYEPNSTHVHTHMRDVLAQRRGVCQDFAHVMLGLCRSLKIPALYVSGYLATETASATHAWVEVFIPGHGWQGLDPTHNCQPDETYVKIGIGRDYADVSPVSGNYRGTQERKMEVEIQIKPLA